MKSSIALLAIAATLGEATFRDAKGYTCPENIPNTCNDKQQAGFDFTDLTPGQFDKYNDFDFNGWTCEGSSDRRRTNKNIIKGECGNTKEKSPSFGCNTNNFSVDHIDVTPEIDTDLEFHYDMPDGSSCKTRSSCSKQGTTVKNSQCGGAKKVTIVFPPQQLGKDKCKVDVGKIGFGCGEAQLPPPPSPPPVVVSTPAPTTLATSFSSPAAVPTPSSPVYSSPPVVPPQESAPAPASSAPGSSASSAAPVESQPASSAPPAAGSSAPAESQPAESQPASSAPPAGSSAPAESQPAESQPAQSQPAESQPVYSQPPAVSSPAPQESVPAVSSAPVYSQPAVSSESPEQPQTTGTPEQPQTPELPCDEVVPRCLVTWLPLVPDCKDNTDAKCFCPSKDFIEKVYECIYSYSNDDKIVDDAVKFVQGICADHVKENPGVVTCAESITKVLTLPPATTTNVDYTTLTIDTTLTVPCVTDGVTVSASYTTTVVSTTLEVPKVTFATTDADIIPVVPTALPVQENNPTPAGGSEETPAGTGAIFPSSTGDFPVTNSAGKVTAGVTAAFLVMLAMF